MFAGKFVNTLQRSGEALWFAAIALALPGLAAAQGIGINFTAQSQVLAPADQPGIVSGANWNNVFGPLGNNVPLSDSNGAATTAQLTYSAAGAYDGFGPTSFANAAANTLYAGGIYGNPTQCCEVSITVSNIPYASYKVYVYASQDTSLTNTLSIADGHTTFYYASNGSSNAGATSMLLTTSTNPASPTTGPAQYQIFSETGSSFTLTTAGSINDLLSNNVFGLQIVPTGDPYLVNYAANLNIFESYINVTNEGANGAALLGPGFAQQVGNICVNVYAFDSGEELISCCSCLLTPDETVNLGVNRDLTGNSVTGAAVNSVTVKLVATLAPPALGGVPGSGTSCNNTAATVTSDGLASGLAAWRTTLHAAPSTGLASPAGGVYTTTETPFTPSTLSPGELASINGRCAGIIGNASGFGICGSCRTGALGATKIPR